MWESNFVCLAYGKLQRFHLSRASYCTKRWHLDRTDPLKMTRVAFYHLMLSPIQVCYLQTASSSHLGRLNVSCASVQIGSSCGCWLGSSCGRLRQASGEELQHLEKKGKLAETQRREHSNTSSPRANPVAALFASLQLALCE